VASGITLQHGNATPSICIDINSRLQAARAFSGSALRASPAATAAAAASAAPAAKAAAAVEPPTPAEIFKRFEARLNAEREASLVGGGAARIATQHKKGKLTARERIEVLADAGTFREYDALVVHRCNDFGMHKEHMCVAGAGGCIKCRHYSCNAGSKPRKVGLLTCLFSSRLIAPFFSTGLGMAW
jgi:hypothetical protein